MKWTRLSTNEEVWTRFATSSTVANLCTEKKEIVRNQVLSALAGGGVERNEEERIILHGLTYFMDRKNIDYIT